MTIGNGGDFSPSDLLALAAASCLMTSFIAEATATGVMPLSYLSTASVADDGAPRSSARVHVHAYVLAASDADRIGLAAVVDAAKHRSPVACLLGDRADLTIELNVINDARPS